MRRLHIGTREISDESPAYVIAEIGGNHGGSVSTACDMVRISAACGADAVKFQVRDNLSLYSDTLLNAAYENEHSYGKTYGEHRQALELSDAALATCCFTAEQSSIACFATAFDEPSVERILKLGMPAIKIASGGLTDHALIRTVAAARVPVVLSTGGGTLKDIDVAVELILRSHDQLAILHCTAAYPVREWAQHNLRCIQTYRDRYACVVGWSGHDNGIALSVAAYTLGARIIEKHVTLDRSLKGTDQAFSLEPAGLKKLCRDLQRAHVAMGDGKKRYYESEVAAISKMRRRLLPDGSLKITGARDVASVD
jgi:sialic acid synthase